MWPGAEAGNEHNSEAQASAFGIYLALVLPKPSLSLLQTEILSCVFQELRNASDPEPGHCFQFAPLEVRALFLIATLWTGPERQGTVCHGALGCRNLWELRACGSGVGANLICGHWTLWHTFSIVCMFPPVFELLKKSLGGVVFEIAWTIWSEGNSSCYVSVPLVRVWSSSLGRATSLVCSKVNPRDWKDTRDFSASMKFAFGGISAKWICISLMKFGKKAENR